MKFHALCITAAVFFCGCSSQAITEVTESHPSPLPSPEMTLAPAPVRTPDSAEIELTAQAAVVYDVASERFIYAKNPDQRLMPASTTKIMTMLVALDVYDPNEVVSVGRAAEAVGHAIDIQPDDQLTVANMVKAMMVNSGNDSAISLADHYPTGYAGFVEAMNRKARAFGMKNTHFSNVSGVEADDHYTTAKDLAILAHEAMKREEVRTIVATKSDSVATIDGKHRYALENLNELLWDVPGVIGIKTGWTPAAGDCLVTYTKRDQDVITVVLNSKDRFKDSRALIEWTYRSFEWNDSNDKL